ncbi:MAG TPA: STAS domain-containing protein [Terriglobales bacterium]|nr:STAS domain-containing protein [Terriglobales bacterium]
MLSLTIHNLDDVTVFRCAGRITTEDETILRNAFLTQPKTRIAVLDLAEVSSVDPAGLGVFTSFRAWVNATGAELKLMNLSPGVEEVLDSARQSALEVCSVPDMIDLLCRAARQFPLSSKAGDRNMNDAGPLGPDRWVAAMAG